MYTPLLKCSKLLLFIAISISITKYVYTQSIISTSPIANQINVDPSSNILIEFDCSIDKESITNNSFVVYGTQTGLRNGSFSYDDSAKVVTYVPDKRFFNGENVRVILTREILTSLGDSLSNSYHFSFTIKSTWGGSSFQEKIDYDTEYRPISLVSADFDQDNDLDVAVVNFGFLSRSISVYMNDGSGAFINKTDYPTGDDPYFISSADFDRDGDMDIVLTNFYSNTFSIFKKVEGANCVSSKNELPKSILLEQNYPNPFNPSTKIKYSLGKPNYTTLSIYNLSGYEIETLFNEFQMTGTYQVSWKTKGLPSGIYFYKIKAGEFSETKKLILQK